MNENIKNVIEMYVKLVKEEYKVGYPFNGTEVVTSISGTITYENRNDKSPVELLIIGRGFHIILDQTLMTDDKKEIRDKYIATQIGHLFLHTSFASTKTFGSTIILHDFDNEEMKKEADLFAEFLLK